MSKIKEKSRKEAFICEFCESTFTCNKNLLRHLRTIKPCCEKSKVSNIKCIWCEQTFLSNLQLDKHKCTSNKESVLISYIEKLKSKDEKIKEIINSKEDMIRSKEEEIKKKEDTIKEKEEQIKDLQEKLYNLANKSTTTNNTTYNVTLNCDKPLLLAKERVLSLMVQHCNISYLRNGGLGLAQWFLKYVCVNDKGNICLECTDKRRKTFKYIDVNDKLVTKSGEEIAEIVDSCKEDFKKCSHFKEYEKEYFDHPYENMNYMLNFFKSNKTFINYLSKVTYTDNIKYIEPIQEQRLN